MSMFSLVWKFSWDEIWLPVSLTTEEESSGFKWLLTNCPLSEDYEQHDDLYSELFRAAFLFLSEAYREATELSEILANPKGAVESFRSLEASDFSSELDIIMFLEAAFDTFLEFEDVLAERYRLLVREFLSKYNLRYRLVEPFNVVPTLSGIFDSLLQRASVISDEHGHVEVLRSEMEDALVAIKKTSSEAAIKHYIHKLINYLEAISSLRNEVTSLTLGKACSEINSWPHKTIRESLSKLYGFSSDFPGIRHAGNVTSKVRNLDMRDLVSLGVILTGYLPYLADGIDCDDLFVPGRTALRGR